MLDHQSAIMEILSDLEVSGHWKGLISAIVQLDDKNPYPKSSKSDQVNPYLMWKEQCGINFPLLYLASIYLYIYAQKHNCHTFLFATRDCCHWYRIFKKMFPDSNVRYLHCSRNMFGRAFRQQHPDYTSYIISTINGDDETNIDLFYENLEKTVFVDLHGTGQHMFSLFRKRFDTTPYCFLLSTGCKSYKDFPTVAKKVIRNDEDHVISLVFDVNGGPIEMLNYDTCGTMQDYSAELGPIRDPIEYPLATVEPYHQCMKFIVGHLVGLETDQMEARYPIEELTALITKIFHINQKNSTVIRQMVHHVGRHKRIKLSKKKKKNKK